MTPSIGFLADDLTGASDVLAQAHAFGLDAALVLDPARVATVAADVVGVAGPARSLHGPALDAAVRAGLAPFGALDVDVLLYKVCSTFDSSPTTGSIGRAVELLREAYPGHGPVPVAPAQPSFGRYTAFSDHYGRYDGQVYRLDRHPVMSRHPSTPMTESDLRLVLAEQLTDGGPVPGLHLTDMADDSFGSRWAEHRGGTAAAFVVDGVHDGHLDLVARALLDRRPGTGPSLVVGSGGIMAALARATTRRHDPAPTGSARSRSSGPTLAVSASASATTAAQIADAVAHGWVEVPVPHESLAAGDLDATVTTQVRAALRAGRDVVAHTALGPDDPRLRGGAGLDAAHVGGAIGRMAARMTTEGLTRDLAICGGDTSSHALAALHVDELRVSEQFVTAAPICHTDDRSAAAGCRLVLKGGQVGPVDVLRRFAGDSRILTPSNGRTS